MTLNSIDTLKSKISFFSILAIVMQFLLFQLQALNVGIFLYILKLLQSTAREIRPLMVFIWAKILAVDSVSIYLF